MDQEAFERFNGDLTAALTAHVPLRAADAPLTISTLESLRQQLTSDLNESSEVELGASFLPWNDKSLPKWYHSALTVFSQTGSMLPVLEGLSVHPLAVRNAYRAMRWTLIYVFIVSAVVILGLTIYLFKVAPSIELLRADIRIPETADYVKRFNILPFLPWVTLGLAIGYATMVGWAFFGGLTKLALWLGGRNYVKFSVSTTIFRISESLVLSGMESETAIQTACGLVSPGQELQSQAHSVVSGSEDASSLGQMADCFRINAFKQLNHLQFRSPLFLLAVVGGGMGLFFSLVVYWPILSIINDLPFSEP